MSKKNNNKRPTPPCVGEFQLVSYQQFSNPIIASYEESRKNGMGWWEKFTSDLTSKWHKPDEAEVKMLQLHEEELAKFIYQSLTPPTRATTESAGFDFKAPFTFTLKSGQSLKIPTGIRVSINHGWWLAIVPRSSVGFKYRAQLDNTIGAIDSDYYYSDNEGHIYIKITNDSKGENKKDMVIQMGEGIAQGIFLPYGTTWSSKPTKQRNGGIGSTNADKKEETH